MNTLPEALRMSDVTDFINRLRQSEKEAWRYADELEKERKRLYEVNQMLVEAAEMAVEALKDEKDFRPNEKCNKAIQALAKAKEQA